MDITTVQLHSKKPESVFCTGLSSFASYQRFVMVRISGSASGWKHHLLTIPQKQFIINSVDLASREFKDSHTFARGIQIAGEKISISRNSLQIMLNKCQTLNLLLLTAWQYLGKIYLCFSTI